MKSFGPPLEFSPAIGTPVVGTPSLASAATLEINLIKAINLSKTANQAPVILS